MSQRLMHWTLALGGLLAVAGCAPGLPSVRFEQSNQLFMERTVEGIDLDAVLSARVPKDAKICLVSMESAETSDHPFIAEIEDQLLTALCADGYAVLERDGDLLQRMIAERSADNFRWMRFPNDMVVSQQGAAVGAASSGWLATGYASGYDRTTVYGANADSVLALETQLAGSEYVLAYRVLECGIVYRKGPQRGTATRDGLLRLHVRLANAKSGQLLYAGNLQSTHEDQVPGVSVRQLANFYYSFYPSNLPLVRGARTEYREIAGPSAKGGDKGELR